MSFWTKKNPVLRTADFDLVAGVLPQVVRAPNPIRVIGRRQANKIRIFLCRAHGVKKKNHATSNKQHGAKDKKSHRSSGKLASNLTGAVTVPGRKKKCKELPGVCSSQRRSAGKKMVPQKELNLFQLKDKLTSCCASRL